MAKGDRSGSGSWDFSKPLNNSVRAALMPYGIRVPNIHEHVSPFAGLSKVLFALLQRAQQVEHFEALCRRELLNLLVRRMRLVIQKISKRGKDHHSHLKTVLLR